MAGWGVQPVKPKKNTKNLLKKKIDTTGLVDSYGANGKFNYREVPWRAKCLLGSFNCLGVVLIVIRAYSSVG